MCIIDRLSFKISFAECLLMADNGRYDNDVLELAGNLVEKC